ncbi:MAG: hypothetical protein KatS3mg039_0057 [Candidatus Kapaibacterium sp.]|nr:MAG: hypothetical protein KatS3mg039_0057 [Candidatus Kapabacteria bacterium]
MVRVVLIALTSALLGIGASAQVYRSSASVGYTATFLLNSPATNLIFSPSSNDSGIVYVNGSRFVGAQSGLTLRYVHALDQQQRWFIPMSIEAIFFRGKQRLESLLFIGRGEVATDVYTLSTGVQYRFADLPLAQAFLYAGIEPRVSVVGGASFSYQVTDKSTGAPVSEYGIDTTLKPTVIRAGGIVRLGAQGVLDDRIMLNLSIAWGAFNLIGRDGRTTDPQRRGQLLTPTRIFETSEAIEQFLQFSLWIQYPL